MTATRIPDPVLRSILARYAAKHVHGQKRYSRLHVTIASYGITNTAWIWTHKFMKHLKISWYCCNCGLPNSNTSLFDYFVELSTPINTTTDTDGSILDISTMGPPLTTSSPKNKPKQQVRNKITKRILRLLIINFQSIRSKKRAFGTCLNKQSLTSSLPPKHGYTKEYLRGKSFQKTTGLLLEETD